MDRWRVTGKSWSTVERQALTRVTEALAERFPAVAAEEIVLRVRRAHGRYAQAPVRDFVAVMVEREVRAELGAFHEPVNVR